MSTRWWVDTCPPGAIHHESVLFCFYNSNGLQVFCSNGLQLTMPAALQGFGSSSLSRRVGHSDRPVDRSDRRAVGSLPRGGGVEWLGSGFGRDQESAHVREAGPKARGPGCEPAPSLKQNHTPLFARQLHHNMQVLSHMEKNRG